MQYGRTLAGHDVRDRYNVACFFASLGDRLSARKHKLSEPALDEAIMQLDIALEDGTLVQWARNDPALRPLEIRRGEEFQKLLDRLDVGSPADSEIVPGDRLR